MAFQIPFRSLTSLNRHLLSKSRSGVQKKKMTPYVCGITSWPLVNCFLFSINVTSCDQFYLWDFVWCLFRFCVCYILVSLFSSYISCVSLGFSLLPRFCFLSMDLWVLNSGTLLLPLFIWQSPMAVNRVKEHQLFDLLVKCVLFKYTFSLFWSFGKCRLCCI